jgi:hypothetical protein
MTPVYCTYSVDVDHTVRDVREQLGCVEPAEGLLRDESVAEAGEGINRFPPRVLHSGVSKAYEQSALYREIRAPLQPFFVGEYRTSRCDVKYTDVAYSPWEPGPAGGQRRPGADSLNGERWCLISPAPSEHLVHADQQPGLSKVSMRCMKTDRRYPGR